jgi:hypothetical protein
LESIGHAIRNGPATAPGGPGKERADYAPAIEDTLLRIRGAEGVGVDAL